MRFALISHGVMALSAACEVVASALTIVLKSAEYGTAHLSVWVAGAVAGLALVAVKASRAITSFPDDEVTD